MHRASTSGLGRRASPGGADPLSDLGHRIEHAAHLLPSQGPITVFVHHNTLHAFEDLPFDEAVKKGAATYGCHPYLTEDFYRGEVARGRISPEDLASVLIDDLADSVDALIGFMGTRYQLRLAMLEHSLRFGTDAELRWLIAETEALRRFRDEAPADARSRSVARTRHWIMRDYRDGRSASEGREDLGVRSLRKQFGASSIERWNDRTWEAFTLHLLWRVCHQGVHGIKPFGEAAPPPVRHRDLLRQATGRDTDQLVNELLIRFCAAFLDQGFAPWPLPGRDSGFFRSFAGLFRGARPVAPWLRGLPDELARIEGVGLSPLESIDESLRLLGVSEAEQPEFLTGTLLALRGWAGMLRQMETNAEWTVYPAPPGTLVEYLAVRLILERLALAHAAGEVFPDPVGLRGLRSALRHRLPHAPRVHVDQRAYLVFQLAQVRGWSPDELHRMSKAEWTRLVHEIESFGGLERRRVYHHAYERRYREETLDALLAHRAPPGQWAGGRPKFQVVCCLDDREESFRRHIEEVEPGAETFGAAGFYGAAIYYRGVADAHFRPLCPVVIKPRHFVVEEPIRSFEEAGRIQEQVRRRLGRISHRLHLGSRTFLGGLLTGLLGSLATAPLLMRVLLPRRTAQFRRLLGRIVTPPDTRLVLERTSPEPGPEADRIGFLPGEMAAIVGDTLRGMGLTRDFAPIVMIIGHGSSSLNNPQAAAYDCGACGGARGGPNARAFARMANDSRVRRLLAEGGLVLPDEVSFVGAFHNTCDDGLTFFDLDDLPSSHAKLFRKARETMDEACRRNAHERCRRFVSAPLSLTPEEALRHVEGRAADLSQVRAECGHATNAVTFVGRRSRTRGLFLDRRTFLTSYDASRDDEEGTILAGLLRAVIPVCAGISLEYYFSRVDNAGYGCGTKLPHNITSLLGVMDGAASDLRPGLPWQMVEIHEPLRNLFVIEAKTEALARVIARDEAIGRLARNEWVQVATIDPDGPAIHVYRGGRFHPYTPRTTDLPVADSSASWYRGWRDHLGYASIVPGTTATSNGRGAFR